MKLRHQNVQDMYTIENNNTIMRNRKSLRNVLQSSYRHITLKFHLILLFRFYGKIDLICNLFVIRNGNFDNWIQYRSSSIHFDLTAKQFVFTVVQCLHVHVLEFSSFQLHVCRCGSFCFQIYVSRFIAHLS